MGQYLVYTCDIEGCPNEQKSDPQEILRAPGWSTLVLTEDGEERGADRKRLCPRHTQALLQAIDNLSMKVS